MKKLLFLLCTIVLSFNLLGCEKGNEVLDEWTVEQAVEGVQSVENHNLVLTYHGTKWKEMKVTVYVENMGITSIHFEYHPRYWGTYSNSGFKLDDLSVAQKTTYDNKVVVVTPTNPVMISESYTNSSIVLIITYTDYEFTIESSSEILREAIEDFFSAK